MVEERANLDYGLDDRPIEEAAELPNDDYLLTDRVAAVDTTDTRLDDVPHTESDEPSTYGAP
jgi:hypothetical protein